MFINLHKKCKSLFFANFSKNDQKYHRFPQRRLRGNETIGDIKGCEPLYGQNFVCAKFWCRNSALRLSQVAVVIFILFLLSGCASIEKKSSENIPVGSEIKKEVMITTAVRNMLSSCSSGDIIKVSLNVIPAPQTPGVIITEKLPEGWKIINSKPAYTKVLSDNSYKWLQWAKQLDVFEVIYEVKVPESAKGNYTFTGSITTYREGVIEITGKKNLVVK